tara:strand:+ start:412 stop:585 length:174 start_codon:yes stop_codon:yes gene_type:complete
VLWGLTNLVALPLVGHDVVLHAVDAPGLEVNDLHHVQDLRKVCGLSFGFIAHKEVHF